MSEIDLFRDLLLKETKKLRETCSDWEKEMQSDLPDHALGLIRSAIGKAKLLMNGKLKQFSRLIEDSTSGSDEKMVTVSDLQGFWDLVSLEISDVDNTFSSLLKLKENSWVEYEPKIQPIQRVPLKVKNVKPCVEIADAHRIAAKKRLQEAKRKMKSHSNETGAKVFEVPVFFSVRSPPTARKEPSRNKEFHEASPKAVVVKDYTPCMRVTRSMKKTLFHE
ncbi:disks large-associated protein 5-like [Ischnura elegans]|uniref:disks large-associated protein 5-like n=1 Tax=Ischnura elegans TaxID=197161 RepID=UPI001ED89313|nr:disks large-associated protein 5-like [Ischnura elegans]